MAGRQRLDQVDAMRPLKQAGVVSTHVLIFFAPHFASTSSNAALLLLHVSREAFFFISACMLTYAYMDLRRGGWRRFYWRRFVSVGIPYLCWNVIYLLWGYRSVSKAWAHLGHELLTGYYQLYFLIVIMEFYLVFPLVLALLKRTRGHHGLVIAVTAAAQLAMCVATHWQYLPPLLVHYAQEDAFNYVLFLIGGGVVAFHLAEVDRWVRANAHLIVALTLLATIFAEAVYYLSKDGVTTVLGSGSDPFQPSVVPFNICAIACVYLVGVALVQPWRSPRVQALVRSGSDNSYGVYLTQLLFITFLSDHGWAQLCEKISWPVMMVVTVVLVYTCAVALTSLLARTPLAVPLTGRKQVPWSTLLPRAWRPAGTPVASARPAGPPEPATLEPATLEPATLESATVAGATDNQNGA